MIKELKKKLYEQIPLTKYMKIDIKSINKNKLMMTAPLNPNINDKGTAFAGSISVLCTISAWCACHFELNNLGHYDFMLAVIKSDISYKKPITKDLLCEVDLPKKEELIILKKKLKEKKSASIKLKANLIQDEMICVRFEGIYVVKI